MDSLSVQSRHTYFSTKKLLRNKVANIKKFLLWNGFPKHVALGLLRSGYSNKAKQTSAKDPLDPNFIKTVWISVPYAGCVGQKIVNRLIKKLKRSMITKVNFKVFYKTKKIAKYCTTKDSTPDELKSHVIYCFECPGCKTQYVGKTDRNFRTRLDEHASDKTVQFYSSF